MSKKIAFFGTPAFVTQFLDALEQHDLKPSLIVTNPDRPVGRGMTMTAPEPKVWGQKHDVAVVQVEKIDDAFVQEMQKTQWDLFVVIAYGHIIPESLIHFPVYGTINVHYSLLPKYRGASPVEAAILNGDTVTGVAVQRMEFALDTGPILGQQEVPIAEDDTTLTLRDKLNAAAVAMLPQLITDIFTSSSHAVPQDENGVSITKKIKKCDGELSLSNDAITNYRAYRAYKDNPGVYFYTERHGKPLRVKITKATYVNGDFVIEEVIPENGKRQSYQDLLHSLN